MSDGKRAVESDKVWTTLITNLDYLSGLLTLNHSLIKSGSAYPLVALYTDTFPAEGLAALERRGIPAQRIEYLLPTKGRDYSNDPRFYDCWSKLSPFSLTQYSRVVQLDSDMLVLRNMDELMELELDDGDFAAEQTPGAAIGGGSPPKSPTLDDLAVKNPSTRVFAAGHACVCNPLKKPHYPSDWTPENCAFSTQHADPDTAQHTGPDPVTASPLGFMNGGLQVVNPSEALFRQIVKHMEQGAMDMDFADQSLLSDLYRGRWVALPYVYNALKTLRWDGVHGEIWRDEEVKNVHYILAPKPWDEIDAVTGEWTGTEESHRWWVDFNRERKAIEIAQGVDDKF
ncbi:glycosyl transferase family 8 [Colletotrichum paranaense]|uniref:Glycosyl transferase family 8 n=4 Tax=Colletotrichum acutatum species complex TaxID=2707335 RepID=A0AAI9VCR6_9PEZI|nr:glycosyl transferase family 8 [Colletotrichum paranaense]XP_060388665.1 glycosyl transferase family 8 [Colletotrichum tamarilloi]KAI3549037.1 glycosyl transferase family 8 [Colletotrichum filicis]KAK0370178.1 glycosyl transferase family 8 [Colletotrichum limetticola]KAK1479921.1 glycosyl transferase family 8 [Colletotrichum cuscutae]KAK1512231.1 glycosyl transferase family 8 [Colletotrichum tamarilloi]KAK1540690.1 glycosyl transferase family 8 [Colletotrichum paranaense]